MDWGPAAQDSLAAAQALGAFTGDEWTVLVVEHGPTGDTWPSPWSVQAPDASTARVVVAALHGGDADVIGVLAGSHALAFWPPRAEPLTGLRQDHPELVAAVRAVLAARIVDAHRSHPSSTSPGPLALDTDPLARDEDQDLTDPTTTEQAGAHR